MLINYDKETIFLTHFKFFSFLIWSFKPNFSTFKTQDAFPDAISGAIILLNIFSWSKQPLTKGLDAGRLCLFEGERSANSFKIFS